MADNASYLDQLRFLFQRLQNVLEHPVQALHGSRLEALIAPTRYQQFLDVNSEVALNQEALAQRKGLAAAPGPQQEHIAEALRAEQVLRDNLANHGANLTVYSDGTVMWTPGAGTARSEPDTALTRYVISQERAAQQSPGEDMPARGTPAYVDWVVREAIRTGHEERCPLQPQQITSIYRNVWAQEMGEQQDLRLAQPTTGQEEPRTTAHQQTPQELLNDLRQRVHDLDTQAPRQDQARPRDQGRGL